MSDEELMQMAEKARERAYAPYSQFTVGAALLCSDETVYLGCNIENASYGAAMCAERVAIYQALADGKDSFFKIAVCGGKGHTDAPCPPCGICRQVLLEFCRNDFSVILKDAGKIVSYRMDQLLPVSFQKNMVENKG